jgi:hypothetical protein
VAGTSSECWPMAIFDREMTKFRTVPPMTQLVKNFPVYRKQVWIYSTSHYLLLIINCLRNYAESDRETRIVCSLFHLTWPLSLQVSVRQGRGNHPHHPREHQQQIAERNDSLTSDASHSGRICQRRGLKNRSGKIHTEFGMHYKIALCLIHLQAMHTREYYWVDTHFSPRY